MSFWIHLWGAQNFLMIKAEMEKLKFLMHAKNWEKKCLERTLNRQKFLQVLKKLEKLDWDGFKQRFITEFLWQTQFWRIWEWSRTMYPIFVWQKKTQFFTLCAIVNTPSPFGSGLRCVWKRKVLIVLDFQLIPPWFFLDMMEKQQQIKALTYSFACRFCINADWTNLSLHLKLL